MQKELLLGNAGMATRLPALVHHCDDMGVVEVIKGTFMLAEEMKAKEIGNAAEPAEFKEGL